MHSGPIIDQYICSVSMISLHLRNDTYFACLLSVTWIFNMYNNSNSHACILRILLKNLTKLQILLRMTFWKNVPLFYLLWHFSVTLRLYVAQKNYNGAQMVMSQMQIAGVKPDSETFSYLILNCESEESIAKVCHVPDHLLLPLSPFMLWFVERHRSWFWRTLS